MKKSVFLLSFVLLWATSVGLAADFVWFSTATQNWKNKGRNDFLEGRLPLSVLDSLDKIYTAAPNRYTVYENVGSLFVYVSCTFDIYEIRGGEIFKKYRYFNQGYTCGTQPFVREDTHYLLGGHGFWRSHMDLMAFDELHGSWELMVTSNQPANYFSPVIFQNSKGVFALFGAEFNPRHGIDSKNTQGYFLDWEHKEWKEVELSIEGLDLEELAEKGGLYFLQTEDYAFWAATNGLKNIGWNLIEKETGKIFYFKSRNVDMGISSYLEIAGNVLTYLAPNGELKIVDLDQIRQESVEVGLIQVKEKAPFGLGLKPAWLYGFFLIAIALGGLVVRKIMPKNKVEEDEGLPTQKLKPLQVLLPLSGQLLNTETLDQLLGIDSQANFDSRRMKRARLITEINMQYMAQHGKELIVRVKMPEDKRYIYYKIQA